MSAAGPGRPGEEGAMKAGANEVENSNGNHQSDSASDHFDEPGRYWTWSTLCPLLAGTFGPMASCFSICALVAHWREYLPAGATDDTGEAIDDPAWLVAVNAISLVAAVIGNMALLLNMAARLRFTIAQPVTIAGFYLASLLLIADMAALTSSSDYRITYAPAIPAANHALTSAFYYAIFAAALYFIVASLMCLTVYGANKGYYEKKFNLTTSQRTLMLQTMSFFVYMLVGALIWSKIEGWTYLDSVYWANTTLLTIGLGDYTPSTSVGQGLLFPFAICGILVLGLVVGSIRTLVLERSEEKMTARIIEKHRDAATDSADVHHQTIRVGLLTHARFDIRPDMSPAQRRGEEFEIMRKVQSIADRERQWVALAGSGFVICVLWFGGAAIFNKAEEAQGYTYLNWLFFSYTSLLTIGYGTPAPLSNSGRAFFVLWTLLAVPSLTILISNMGDTVVKEISDLTDLLGSITVLPGEQGFRATVKGMLKRIKPSSFPLNFTGPGLFGDAPQARGGNFQPTSKSENHMLDLLAERMTLHVTSAELEKDVQADLPESDGLDCDIYFYHYVLAREIRDVMKDLGSSPPKKYGWGDWEYFIKLIGNDAADPETCQEFPGQDIPNMLVPEEMAVHREKTDEMESPKLKHLKSQDRVALQNSETWSMPWSWLSNESPLMCMGSESQWIVERLSAALERELNRTRRGFKRKPPISYRDLRKYMVQKSGDSDTAADSSQENEKDNTELTKLQKAALSEE